MKNCNRSNCLQANPQPLLNFYRKGKAHSCKSCMNQDTYEYRRKNPRYKKNSHLKHLYGISLEIYNQLFEQQDGCCRICQTHQSSFKKALAVDHCHQTGKVRGLLCAGCNTALGGFRDKIQNLEKAITYLKDSQNE